MRQVHWQSSHAPAESLSPSVASVLQDALGRSALMFAAGNCAEAALLALLAAGATLGLRDRRSRSVLDYAPEGSKVKQQLLDRYCESSLR